MGDKSVRKQKYIVEKARKVFSEKGFKNVSMKDIVDACEISRGGLYIYFASTEELFLEVLNSETDSEDAFSGKVTDKSTAAEILVLFLLDQKREILNKKESLAKAVYEFYFEARPKKEDNVILKELSTATQVLEQIISLGVKNGELVCTNPPEAAKNIMFTMEGLKIAANTIGVTSETVDKQFLYILSTLGVEDDEAAR